MYESESLPMVVLSEGWVQFLLAISCVLLLVISLLAIFSWLKRKKGITKAKEQAGAFLVFVTVLLIYFALSLALPRAYVSDVLIGPKTAKPVEDNGVRYLSLSTIYKVHGIETGAVIREAQGKTVHISINEYEPIYEFAKANEEVVRNDQSIDVAAYIDQVAVPELEKLDNEEITLTQLRERLPHLQFDFQ
ncbi:hypothetical protein P5F80_06115 [Shouchella clausii]|uniref:hypothetical protein n=1 Tax=Shouchella clausii TaxID=79880 RepID=UPI000BA6FA36|nr:hypothetical protein [Shouchella clausii]PAD43078.1 hypothetical protein CHH54_08680 [Bacillus sp. 7520-S]MED4159290.1 hypothetical protein [Shouchella clausii]MED4176094.1 hypothetical protein [Shouchella clausii]PAD91500.1 hypothetical protein CHH52_14610 [Shouchella clausii]PAE97853.1 hypothetical protein CHH71_07040 [Shouchella clausii]